MKEPIKLCKDCKSSYGLSPDNLHCNCNKITRVLDYSTGKYEAEFEYCSIQRNAGYIYSLMERRCGKGARWFEPKEK